MTALVHAELLKVRTVRSWWAYLIVIPLLVALATVSELGPSGQPLDEVDFQVGLVEASQIAGLISIILGITVVTSEFRHGTITPTTLVEPRRARVVAAKTVASVLVAASFLLLALAVVVLVTAIWYAIVGAELHLLDGEPLTRAAQSLLFAILWTLLGVAIGTLVHSQVAALVGTLVFFFAVTPLLYGLFILLDVEGLFSYLPFIALDSADGTNESDMLEYWPGVAVSLAWIAAIGAAGTARTMRRDLT